MVSHFFVQEASIPFEAGVQRKAQKQEIVPLEPLRCVWEAVRVFVRVWVKIYMEAQCTLYTYIHECVRMYMTDACMHNKYIHPYTHTFVHSHIQHMHSYIHPYMHTQHMHECMHTCVYSCINTLIHTTLQVCMYAFMHAHKVRSGISKSCELVWVMIEHVLIYRYESASLAN